MVNYAFKKTAISWGSNVFVVVVQLLNCFRLFATLRTAGCQASVSFAISRSLLIFMPIELVILSKHLTLCHPLHLTSSFPTSGSFPMSQLFASGGQIIGVSASVLPMTVQGLFPLGLNSFRKSTLMYSVVIRVNNTLL